ncbi:MAG: hypothetical protein Q8K98_07520 [Bacteroidota bacterium]|nr:hypothetical protein [Bacteroidota bacterium]
MKIKIFILPLLALFILTSVLSAQQTKNNPNWDSWNFLLGEWIGEGGGDPGKGVGGFSFYLDLQKTILIRKNYAQYPATTDRPAFRHDDLMVIYKNKDNSTRATYWDNEGHVINYSTETNSVIFLSDLSPASPRFRLTYTKRGKDTLNILFEIAPHGKPDAFSKYIEATAHRKWYLINKSL